MLIVQIILVIENHFFYLLLSMIFKFLYQLHRGIMAILLNSVNFHDMGNQAVPAVPLDYQ